MSSSASYQGQIDGLRAVAVLSVIFYHFGLSGFRGGYVGVDVFFVISGFLITRLILDEIFETGRFEFKRFYIRRIRRLFPALSVTLALSLGLAIVLFSPEQFQRFGRSLAAAVFSVSNILFWTESGYFDVDSHLKPLLHTWSLSVEEQFYLLWPGLLWGVTRGVERRWQPYVLASIALASLALNHLWVVGGFDQEYASSIFFLTPFRIFELSMGAMALYAAPLFSSRRWLSELGMCLGLTMIGSSVVAYSDDLVFPYYYALLPCFGAFLVILSGGSRVVGAVLTNPAAIGIGVISYSLYLVHWPALIFFEHYKFEKPSQAEYVLGFLASIGIATGMYFFVEKPLRRNAPTRVNPAPQGTFVLSSLGTMAAIGLIGFQIGGSAGWVWRDPNALTATAVAEGKQRRFDLVHPGCDILELADPNACKMDRPGQILVFGDSHEVDGYNAFSAIYADDREVNLISFGAFNDCDVQFAESGPFSIVPYCAPRVARLNDAEFLASLSGLVFSSNKAFHPSATMIWNVIEYLKRKRPDLPVAVLGGFINTHRDCSELYSEFHTFGACKEARFVSFSAFDEREVWVPDGVAASEYVYIDKMRLLCRDGTLASCDVEARGEPAFYDTHHLSLGFALHLGEQIAHVYADELERVGFPSPRRAD